MNLEGIMLSAKSQKEKDKQINTAWHHLQMESKKERSQNHVNGEQKWWLSGAKGNGGWEKWEGAGKRVQTFSYSMNKV